MGNKYIVSMDPAGQNPDTGASAVVKIENGVVTAIISVSDVPDSHGDVYTKDCMEKMVENYNQKQKES